MERRKNIVFFSSGVSEKGLLPFLIDGLNNRNFNCSSWRDLFADANDTNNIALLPMLIKKIPTFDYAVIVCDGHDRTIMLRDNNEILLHTMRDNVIFEIGLCAMALGLDKIVLVTDNSVHLPDDFVGVEGKSAIKQVTYIRERMTMSDTLDIVEKLLTPKENLISDISHQLDNMSSKVSLAVVGAAASAASGYVSNFVFRLLESVNKPIYNAQTNEIISTDNNRVFLHIMLPDIYSSDLPKKVDKIKKQYIKGIIRSARSRPVMFDCLTDSEGNVHIYDYPTTLSTTYDTAKIILDMDADDSKDIRAEERFVSKEKDLFAATLNELIHSPEYALRVMEPYYSGADLLQKISQVKKMVENNTEIEEYSAESLLE